MNGSLGSLIILLYNIYFTISFYIYVYIYVLEYIVHSGNLTTQILQIYFVKFIL